MTRSVLIFLFSLCRFPFRSTLDVKGIIQQWYKDLAADAQAFEEQAQRVGLWDQQLRDNQKVCAVLVVCVNMKESVLQF
jgi:hypothetical protein